LFPFNEKTLWLKNAVVVSLMCYQRTIFPSTESI